MISISVAEDVEVCVVNYNDLVNPTKTDNNWLVKCMAASPSSCWLSVKDSVFVQIMEQY